MSPTGEAGSADLVAGTTRRLAELAGRGPAGSRTEVLARLAAVRDHAGTTSTAGPEDGIAAFAGLYHDTTARLAALADAGRFAEPRFLLRLEVELADRFADALRSYAADAPRAPAAWRVLFDNRANPAVPAGGCALAGVNAQLNLDLAAALVSTWEHLPPDDGGPDSPQYRDYCLLTDVVESAVEPLREGLGPTDAGHLTDLAVRFSRDLAWDEAREVWTDGADEQRRLRSAQKLDVIAGWLGPRLLGLP